MRQAPPRLLGRRLGYTDRPELAMRNEPEAIDAATQRRYATQARGHERARLAADELGPAVEDVTLGDLERRLARLRAIAAARGVDLSAQIKSIERQVARIEGKVLREPTGDDG